MMIHIFHKWKPVGVTQIETYCDDERTAGKDYTLARYICTSCIATKTKKLKGWWKLYQLQGGFDDDET